MRYVTEKNSLNYFEDIRSCFHSKRKQGSMLFSQDRLRSPRNTMFRSKRFSSDRERGRDRVGKGGRVEQWNKGDISII